MNDNEDFDENAIKNAIMYSLCETPDVKKSVMESVPDILKPFAFINPFQPDALEQIKMVSEIMNPPSFPSQLEKLPSWIQKLVDNGLVENDGKTVIANSLMTVACAIRDNENIVVTQNHLKRFIKAKDRKPYSIGQIKDVLSTVNN